MELTTVQCDRERTRCPLKSVGHIMTLLRDYYKLQ